MLDNRWDFLEDEYEEESRFVRIPRKNEYDGYSDSIRKDKMEKRKRREARIMKEHQVDDAPLPIKDDDTR